MKLTKFEHACFMVEEQGQRLLVDPGVLTQLPDNLENIIGLVITHNHPDHLDQEKVTAIRAANPGLQIFGAKEVVANLEGAILPEVGTNYTAGIFKLRFYGELHASIHAGWQAIHNFGVMINDRIYYPGDSFTLPDVAVEVLLAPAAAPWMKVSEAMEFITNIKARIVIPTHDAVLSEAGMSFQDGWLKPATEQAGGNYRRLQSGESIDL